MHSEVWGRMGDALCRDLDETAPTPARRVLFIIEIHEGLEAQLGLAATWGWLHGGRADAAATRRGFRRRRGGLGIILEPTIELRDQHNELVVGQSVPCWRWRLWHRFLVVAFIVAEAHKVAAQRRTCDGSATFETRESLVPARLTIAGRNSGGGGRGAGGLGHDRGLALGHSADGNRSGGA